MVGAFLSGTVVNRTITRVPSLASPTGVVQTVAPPRMVPLPSPTVVPRAPIVPIPMTPPRLNPDAGVILPSTQPGGAIGSDAVINFGHLPVVTPPSISVTGAAPGIVRPVFIGTRQQDGGVITGTPSTEYTGPNTSSVVAATSAPGATATSTKSVTATSPAPSNMKVLLILGALTALYFVIDGKRK